MDDCHPDNVVDWEGERNRRKMHVPRRGPRAGRRKDEVTDEWYRRELDHIRAELREQRADIRELREQRSRSGGSLAVVLTVGGWLAAIVSGLFLAVARGWLTL